MAAKKYSKTHYLRIIFSVVSICCLENFSSLAQENNLAIGQWRIHLPFNKLNTVAEGNGVIYCAATDGLFVYKKDDGVISRLTRLEGLSDFDIKHIRYNHSYNVLVVVYQNSNIDLIKDDNSIFNISDILRANILGIKTINHIDFNGRYAYLSCGFGIVVLDLVRREIKDTYYFGPNGNQVNVYGTIIYGSEFFSATDDGIYRADINNPQLSLYTSWIKDTTLPQPNYPYNFISLYGNKLVANNDSVHGQSNSLMVFDGTSWTYFNLNDQTAPSRVEFYGSHLTRVNGYSISAFDEAGNRTHYVDAGAYDSCCHRNSNSQDGFVDSDNILWIADGTNGLVRYVNATDITFIYPNGPASTSVYAMAAKDSRIWVAGGMINSSGFYNSYSKDGAYLLKNNQWKTFDKTTNPALDTVAFFDFITVAVDPDDGDHAFVGSWGRGIFEFRENGIQNIFTTANSPLQSVASVSYQIQIGGLAFDSNKNLWVCNSAVSQPILKRKPDGTWQAYSVPLLLNSIPQGIMCDSRDRKWIVLPWTGGLAVFDEQNTFSHPADEVQDLHARRFTTASGKGKLPSIDVQCIAEDKDGQIWIGTAKGVGVLYSPDNVYSGNYDFSQVTLQQDGNWQHLLETETVTAIAIDGANYKWFGTASSGVFWMSPDGTKLLGHYTTENSPLLSNYIFTIAIDQKTGEVFIGTEKGIVSVKGVAIEGSENFDSVYVYPNPIRPGYNGIIAIRGLVASANVKITDVSGNIVYETASLGGQAIWDGKNFKGERAQSGVYLVFCSNDDGTKTFVTKLLFMH
jgi:hypothetical protein